MQASTTLGEQIAIETGAAADIWPVRADPVQLQNAILNLAINARDAMPDGGRLSIEASNFELDEAFAPIYPDLKPGAYEGSQAQAAIEHVMRATEEAGQAAERAAQEAERRMREAHSVFKTARANSRS